MIDDEIEKADTQGYEDLCALIDAWDCGDWKLAQEAYNAIKEHLDFLVEQD